MCQRTMEFVLKVFVINLHINVSYRSFNYVNMYNNLCTVYMLACIQYTVNYRAYMFCFHTTEG